MCRERWRVAGVLKSEIENSGQEGMGRGEVEGKGRLKSQIENAEGGRGCCERGGGETSD